MKRLGNYFLQGLLLIAPLVVTGYIVFKVFQLNTNIDYSSGSVVSKTIIKKEAGTVTLFSFDKGQGLSPHVAPFDALVQVIDGECSFTVGTEKNSMKTGMKKLKYS